MGLRPIANPLPTMPLFLLVLIALISAAVLPAQDDRDRTTPVESQWLTDRTDTDLAALQASGWRFTDLDITSNAGAPLRFSVVMVKNTGAYAKTWTYVTAATPVQLSNLTQQQNLRIVDLEPHDIFGSNPLFAAVLIANTGVDAKTWWWGHDKTAAQVDAAVNANNGRLVGLKRYQLLFQQRYAYVMIANTGADQRAWGYLYDASTTTIEQTIGTGMRVYAMERNDTGTYDAIFVDDPTNVVTSFETLLTPAQARAYVEQNLERIVDVEPYTVTTPPLTFSFCAVTTLDNANPLEQTARYWFTNNNPASRGDYGFFLKEVNGPVLAAMRPDTPFEPAGLMTTLYHVHAMRRVSLGVSSLTGTLNKPVSCGSISVPVSLGTLLTQMMENGDTLAALAISNAYGIPNLEVTADALGMTSTNINYTLGCSGPSPESTMTLRDLSKLHEAVANGYLHPAVTDFRPTFYEKMREALTFPTWNANHLDSWISFYAASIGMTPAAVDVFEKKLHIAYTPGGASWPVSGTDHFYYSEGGWMSVPFRAANGLLAPKEFTFGVFNHDFHALETEGREWMCYAELELVWDRVKAALDTWTDYVPGSITFMPGGSCLGSGGLSILSSTSLPDLEETVVYSLVNAPANGIVVTMFGFSDTSWNGVPLPASLTPIGANGCILRTEPSVTFAGLANASGQLGTPIVIGTDTSLIGAVWFTQCLLLDPPANAFGATLSNGLRTQIGGSF